MLAGVDLIIWDEVPMQHKHCFAAMHRLLLDLRSASGYAHAEPPLFRGVPVILSGDFAQILPVIPQGLQLQIVNACLQQSFLWPQLKQLHLQINMCIRNGSQAAGADRDFISWVGRLLYDSALISKAVQS